MKIFLISPVRELQPGLKMLLENWVRGREEAGDRVYWPFRDTDQNASSRLICLSNRTGIEAADCVAVAWDGNSKGTLFDLGMAYAMDKPIWSVKGLLPSRTMGKSFENFLLDITKAQLNRPEWAERWPVPTPKIVREFAS